MMEVLIITNLLLVLIVVLQYKILTTRKRAIIKIKGSLEDEQLKQIEVAERLASASSLSTMEIMEIMQEQQEVVTVDSDIWQAEMPYGKWAEFSDGTGRPPPLIRGFWYKCPGRLIGVKMPLNSEYDMHHHPWKETLIGVSGLVIVEIERTDKSISKHRLGPDDVVEIPPGVKHAVAKAKTASELICIWGVPKKLSKP